MLKTKVDDYTIMFYTYKEVRAVHLLKTVPITDRYFTMIPTLDSNHEGQIFVEKPVSGDMLLKITGHNPAKIDFAVPQPWFEEYREKHGEYPRAVWSYENIKGWGEPLMIKDLQNAYQIKMREIFYEMLNDLVENNVRILHDAVS